MMTWTYTKFHLLKQFHPVQLIFSSGFPTIALFPTNFPQLLYYHYCSLFCHRGQRQLSMMQMLRLFAFVFVNVFELYCYIKNIVPCFVISDGGSSTM